MKSLPTTHTKPPRTSLEVLLHYAFKLLGQRRYTTQQISKKLALKKIGTPQEISLVLERLKQLHYLDDELFAELFIEDSLRRKPQGLKMIRNNLMKKGIPLPLIAKAFQGKNINELSVAKHALEKKQLTIHKFPPIKQKEKLFRFMMSRGFSRTTIFKILPDMGE